RPLWGRHPETASRVLNRIKNVLDWATAAGLRTGENPARWVGHIEHLLRAHGGAVEHLAAMDYRLMPSFVAKLRAHGTTAARALEFLITCAARSNETLGAVFGEIDFANEVWVIPGSRMKSGREHRVPLPQRAVDILREQRAFGESGPVFRGRDGVKPLGPTSL